MRDQEIIIKILNDILNFSKNYQDSIDWNKLKKDLVKLESQFKNLIIPSNKVKDIFSNKNHFTNLTEIKEFMFKNFNHNIRERTTTGILSDITYLTMKNPDLIPKIENIIISKPVKQEKIFKQKKTPQRKIIQPKGETWRDWTNYESEELREYLKSLTLAYIKPKLGNLLISSEKKQKKADLIETIIKKIKKLKTHYEMGPG
jgi:hypothetical protein